MRALALAALLLAVAGCNREPADPVELARLRLTQEFAGSYPSKAPRSTGLREFEITAAPARIRILDGRPLELWAYSGRVPGPELRVRFGQTVRVHFHNKLEQATTVHWHGVRVPNAMDGVPYLTQDPVAPGESFLYEFTPKDPGTYWFHPHIRSSEQVERGLYGVLIVEDAEPLAWNQDLVWVLDDWRLSPGGGSIDPNFVTRHDLAHDGRWGSVISVNGTIGPTLKLAPGERVRLRLLNAANGRVFAPDFGGLEATVIAVDGKYAARPFALERFEMAPGNRLDIDLTAPDKVGEVFVVTDKYSARRTNLLARISIEGERVATPAFEAPRATKFPSWEETSAIPPTLEYKLDARLGGPFGVEWTMNDRVMYHDGPDAHAEHNRRDSLQVGRWAKLRFANVSPRIHPMHIHGQFFKVLARNGEPVDEPFWRDTVLTHARETVDVGLVPLDEGAWMLHCHILEHAEAGMMTVVEVSSAPSQQVPTQAASSVEPEPAKP